jgi:hypothetical protein
MKSMRLVGFLLTLLLGLSAFADENQIRIGGGPATGEYINIAKSLCASLGKLFQCQPMETSGTLDNRKRLEAGQVEIALAKSNAADDWMKDPSFAAKYTIVRRIGDESLFVFGKPEILQAVGSWLGVRENAFLLSIGLPGELSGDTTVFNALKNVSGSPLAQMEVKMFPDRPTLVEAVRTGKVKLGFITQVPNPNNPLFASINDSGLMIMGVVDPDMITFGETFRIKPVTVKNAKWFGLGGGAQQIETANVPAAIVAVKSGSLQGRMAMVQQAAIKKILEAGEADLLPQQSWMQDLANTTSLKAGAGLDNAMKSMEKAAAGAKERLGKL